MAERLSPEEGAYALRRTRRYPWNDWQNGEVWVIREGEDFDMTTEHMARYLYARARKIWQRVTVNRRDDMVTFQFWSTEHGAPKPTLPNAPLPGRPPVGTNNYLRASAERYKAERRERHQREIDAGSPQPTDEAMLKRAEEFRKLRASSLQPKFRDFKPEPVSPEARYDD